MALLVAGGVIYALAQSNEGGALAGREGAPEGANGPIVVSAAPSPTGEPAAVVSETSPLPAPVESPPRAVSPVPLIPAPGSLQIPEVSSSGAPGIIGTPIQSVPNQGG